MADIELVIDNLLKEEIGKHMCDSGGAYGYRYEKNREEGCLKGLNPVEEYTDEERNKRGAEWTESQSLVPTKDIQPLRFQLYEQVLLGFLVACSQMDPNQYSSDNT